jgi:hypothetical protein
MAANPFQPAPAFGFKTITPPAFYKLITKVSATDPGSGVADDDQHAVDFVISMASIDHNVLDILDKRWGLLQGLVKSENHDALLQHLFCNWDWTYTLSSNIVNLLTNPVGYSGLDQDQYFQNALHLSGSFKGHAIEQFRAEIARDDNGDFLQRLGDRSVAQVNFIPPRKDERYWDMVAAMYLRFPAEMLFWTNAPARRRLYKRRNQSLEWFVGHYSIHILCRIFDLRCRRPSNVALMEGILQASTNADELLLSMRHAGAPGLELLQYQDTVPGNNTQISLRSSNRSEMEPPGNETTEENAELEQVEQDLEAQASDENVSASTSDLIDPKLHGSAAVFEEADTPGSDENESENEEAAGTSASIAVG